MSASKKAILGAVFTSLTLVSAGCTILKEPVAVILKPDANKHESGEVAKRFQEAAPDSATSTDSAIELAKKNAQLTEEVVSLKQKVQEMTSENQRLKDNISVLEPDLKQAKKELGEANNLMIEMRVELNNWKTDVLGFRNELRDADKVQLETLRKILDALGGEVETKASQEQNKGSTSVSMNKETKSG